MKKLVNLLLKKDVTREIKYICIYMYMYIYIQYKVHQIYWFKITQLKEPNKIRKKNQKNNVLIKINKINKVFFHFQYIYIFNINNI